MCPRCEGLLVNDPDTLSLSPTVRCVNCGELVDALVLFHRSYQKRKEPKHERQCMDRK